MDPFNLLFDMVARQMLLQKFLETTNRALGQGGNGLRTGGLSGDQGQTPNQTPNLLSDIRDSADFEQQRMQDVLQRIGGLPNGLPSFQLPQGVMTNGVIQATGNWSPQPGGPSSGQILGDLGSASMPSLRPVSWSPSGAPPPASPSALGPVAGPDDKELAALAENAVFDQGAPPGFTRIENHNLPSGLQAATYRNDATGEVVTAFRGNDDPGLGLDELSVVAQAGQWFPGVTELSQQLGWNAQFEEAKAIAADTAGRYPNVTFTGHSHGGTLASLASLHTGRPAVTFNGGGLHDDTLRAAGLDPTAARAAADNQIRSYFVQGEFADLLSRGFPAPVNLGRRIPLLNPGVDAFAAHNMDVVRRQLDAGAIG